MIPMRKIINYATAFLLSEIDYIEEFLDKQEVSNEDKKIFLKILNEYKKDYKEIMEEV